MSHNQRSCLTTTKPSRLGTLKVRLFKPKHSITGIKYGSGSIMLCGCALVQAQRVSEQNTNRHLGPDLQRSQIGGAECLHKIKIAGAISKCVAHYPQRLHVQWITGAKEMQIAVFK
ncbi:hypothetical protein CHARACLAT_032300 [Characodon lateralis]|uniref:Uncharacterized protein n=1 Tax=Characodon lateralis TaxID=208331 RepID=A0ABU7EHW9_9TELE|nr:hypothetical protein [Characodon lateralis]